MRLKRLFVLLVAMCSVACADVKALMSLSAALHSEYHMEAKVNLKNSSHLTITFPAESIEALKLDSAGRAGFARDVATFAKGHYQQAARLEDVSIAFASETKFAGAELTRTETPYTFRAGELP
jgi:hypothetical protein